MNEYDEKWEERINALLDGELSADDAELLKAEASDDRELARAIVEAYQLQQAMDEVRVERAPSSLSKRLNAIPRQQRKAQTFSFLHPEVDCSYLESELEVYLPKNFCLILFIHFDLTAM